MSRRTYGRRRLPIIERGPHVRGDLCGCGGVSVDFERSVQRRSEKITKSGRTKLSADAKKSTVGSAEVKPGVATSPFPTYSDVAEGRRVENDVFVNGIIAMLDHLKEHRNAPGYVHRERKNDPNGMWDPSFFAARPGQRNEYTADENAMGAYWKEWEKTEENKVWRWEALTEWWKVSAEARAKGEEIQFTLGSYSDLW